MRTYLVLTATGRDRPGVVDVVTDKLLAFEANIEESRMSRLGGDFAMLALVAVEEDAEGALLASLGSLEAEGLKATARRTDPTLAPGYEDHSPFEVRVQGADHPGIINKVAHELAELGVNIETMDTEISSAPLSGAPSFTMVALVYAPPGIEFGDLRATLDDVGDELAVDIEVAPPGKSHP